MSSAQALALPLPAGWQPGCYGWDGKSGYLSHGRMAVCMHMDLLSLSSCFSLLLATDLCRRCCCLGLSTMQPRRSMRLPEQLRHTKNQSPHLVCVPRAAEFPLNNTDQLKQQRSFILTDRMAKRIRQTTCKHFKKVRLLFDCADSRLSDSFAGLMPPSPRHHSLPLTFSSGSTEL